MALKKELESNPEVSALKDLEGIDVSQFQSGEGDPPPADPPAGDPPAGDPPKGGDKEDPPKGETKKDTDPPAPDPHDVLLKEIFGDRYKTVDEAKSANITGQLEELEGLRRTKQELEEKLATKPKSNFVSDEVALYNEFVRETGVKDYGVFSRINGVDPANMDDMDALVTRHILQNPQLAGKEPQVRKLFEKKYNLDPDQVDEDELELNKLELSSDAHAAKRQLTEVKGKLKVPDPEPEPEKPKELTPEEKASLQKGWGNVGSKVSETLSKLQVPIKGRDEPLLSYELSADDVSEMGKFITDYATQNQMELNEANVKTVAQMVYYRLLNNKFPEIVHSVFEKARGMTKEEVEAFYENSAPVRNNDQPPSGPDTEKPAQEKEADDIFDAEMGKYNT